MVKKNYETLGKIENKTNETELARWRKYYENNREYHLNRNRTYYLERLVKWYEWFDSLGLMECEICGFNEHPKAIDFHHINPKEKSFGIGKFINGRQCNKENKSLVKKEIDKCMCLCANCHRIKHFIDTNESNSKNEIK